MRRMDEVYYFLNRKDYALPWRIISGHIKDVFGEPDDAFMVQTPWNASSRVGISIDDCDLYHKSFLNFDDRLFMVHKVGQPRLPRMRRVGEHFRSPIFLFSFGRIRPIERIDNYLIINPLKHNPYWKEKGWMELMLADPFMEPGKTYEKMHYLRLVGSDPDDVIEESYNFILQELRRNGMRTMGNDSLSRFKDD